MRVFVTGGCGFIGSYLVRKLTSLGHEVSVLDIVLPSEPVKGVEYHLGTVQDEYMLRRLMKGHEKVVHLAAMLGVTRTDEDALICMNVNVVGTQRLLEAALWSGVRHVLLASSSEVLGEGGPSPFQEDAVPAPKSVYATSKLAGEWFAKGYAQANSDFAYTIVRFFNVYGPGQVAQFVLPKFVSQVRDDAPLKLYGGGTQVRAFCHVQDATVAVAGLLETKDSFNQTFHVGNPAEPVSMEHLAEQVYVGMEARTCQPVTRKVEVVPLGQERDPSREVHRRVPCVEKLKATLPGWSPKVSLFDGIQSLLGVEIPGNWRSPAVPHAWMAE